LEFEVNQPFFGSLSCAALAGLVFFWLLLPGLTARTISCRPFGVFALGQGGASIPLGGALLEPLFSQLLLKTAVYSFTCCPQNGTYID
jgi:hypothetical protein